MYKVKKSVMISEDQCSGFASRFFDWQAETAGNTLCIHEDFWAVRRKRCQKTLCSDSEILPKITRRNSLWE